MATAEDSSQRRDRFSYYYLTLEEIAQSRYREKLALLGDIVDRMLHWKRGQLLSVTVAAKVNKVWTGRTRLMWITQISTTTSLKFRLSVYTKQELKAYKSLEGYKFFTDGWVSDVVVLPLTSRANVCLASCKVKHSQRLSAPPLQPWVAVEKEGLEVCAHCDCVGGSLLSYRCSSVYVGGKFTTKKELVMYIIALLLVATNIQNCAVCKNLWHRLHSPTKKHRQLLNDQQVPLSTPPSSNPTSDMKPSASELDSFFKTLSETGKPAAILSIVPSFCEAYVPLQVKGDLPSPLKNLYNESFSSLTYPELLLKCEEAYNNLSITSNQANLVEVKTRNQSNSKIWYQQRAGRIKSTKVLMPRW